MTEQTSRSDRPKADHGTIAHLNDALRAHITSPGPNHIVMTAGIAELVGDVALFRGFQKRAELMRTVRDFDTFDHDSDPHGHRDLGLFEFEATACMWKIDYYNADLSAGSENPANPLQTVRVLTILRADEW